MRTCGPCSACCYVFAIADVATLPYTRCAQLTQSGCGIYPSRPGACRAYACGWIVDGAWFDEAERPDLVGLVPAVPTGIASVPMVIREIDAGSADTPAARAMLDRLASLQLVMLIRRDGAAELLGPPALVAAASYLL